MNMSGTARLAQSESVETAASNPSTGNVARRDAVDGTYRDWVSEHRVSAAVLAGLVATHIATVIGYWMPGIGLPQLDWNRVNGLIYTPHGSADLQFLSGGIFHYADGIAFAVLFAIAVHGREYTQRPVLRHYPCHHQLCLHDSAGVLPARPRWILQP
jgi:hypothetical protein